MCTCSTMKTCQLFVVVLIISVCCTVNAQPPAESKKTISTADVQYGPANVKGEDKDYYYLKLRINAKSAAGFTFKQDSSPLYDSIGKKYSDYWVAVTGASAGVSLGKTAPIEMKTFEAAPGSGSASITLNCSRIDGPKGEISFNLPKNGFVDLYFLWPVAKGFKPGRLRLEGITEIKLSKR